MTAVRSSGGVRSHSVQLVTVVVHHIGAHARAEVSHTRRRVPWVTAPHDEHFAYETLHVDDTLHIRHCITRTICI